MTTKALASLDIYKFLRELDYLESAVVRDVRSRKNELFILLYNRGEYWLKIVPGEYMCVVKEKPRDTVDFPFTLMLKNELVGSNIAISMHMSDRIVELSTDDTTVVIELFSDGNVILVKNGTIAQAMFARDYGVRKVMAGEPYEYPPSNADIFNMEYYDFEKTMKLSYKDSLVTALAVDFSLGGMYSEEICLRAGVGRLTKPNELAGQQLESVFLVIKSLLSAPSKPNIIDDSILAVIDITHLGGRKVYFDTINDAIVSFFGGTAAEEKRGGFDKTKPKELSEEYAKFLGFLNTNYNKIEDIVKKAKDSEKNIEERKTELKSLGWNLEGKFLRTPKYPNFKLDITKTLRDNMSSYYEKAKRYKAALARERAKPPKPRRLAFRKNDAWYSKFRWLFTSNGLLVVLGRDVSQNAALMRKYAEPNDVVLHSDVFGSPFALVKPKLGEKIADDDLREAAIAVGSYSSAWKAGAGNIDVYSVRPDQVTSTPPSGEFLKKGAFYIEGKRNYIKGAQLGIYIEFDVFDEKEYDIRVSAHRPKSNFIMVRPGNKKREEVLKHIKRTVLEKLNLDVEEDRIDRLIPSGKASIEKAAFDK